MMTYLEYVGLPVSKQRRCNEERKAPNKHDEVPDPNMITLFFLPNILILSLEKKGNKEKYWPQKIMQEYWATRALLVQYSCIFFSDQYSSMVPFFLPISDIFGTKIRLSPMSCKSLPLLNFKDDATLVVISFI